MLNDQKGAFSERDRPYALGFNRFKRPLIGDPDRSKGRSSAFCMAINRNQIA